jgi:hypothetical protein
VGGVVVFLFLGYYWALLFVYPRYGGVSGNKGKIEEGYK